uniref:NAD-dependent protein deacetylase sirtuin-2 n=1 Tax=Ailuropoda melanoleuca TaxID=9646 RepID=A0A7N5JU02_AILME
MQYWVPCQCLEVSGCGRVGDPRAGWGPCAQPPPCCSLSAFWPVDFLRNFFSQTLGLGTQKERLLDELTLEGVTRYMQSERCRRVICLVGAGISTSAGIPDFRSPSTGLYANLEKYHLPYPEAIFEIGYFKKHPEPFFALAKELYPGQFKPTVCHYFIRLLKEKGLLLRCYTQNIDTLERVAGLESEDLVEAHGTFHTSHCTSPLCRREYTLSWMKEKIFSEVTPKCEKCHSVVKPDIVFFGENLPARFFSCMQSVSRPTDMGAARALWGGRWLPQLAAAGVWGEAAQPPPSLWGPHQLPPFIGLPEGGSPHHHGHLPAGAALRLPHQQVGWGLAGGGGPGQARSSPLSSPSPRAPLSTPRLLINKEKTGQVSWLLCGPPSDFPSPFSSQGYHIPFHWLPQKLGTPPAQNQEF